MYLALTHPISEANLDRLTADRPSAAVSGYAACALRARLVLIASLRLGSGDRLSKLSGRWGTSLGKKNLEQFARTSSSRMHSNRIAFLTYNVLKFYTHIAVTPTVLALWKGTRSLCVYAPLISTSSGTAL